MTYLSHGDNLQGIKSFKFPTGEIQVTVDVPMDNTIDISYNFTGSDSIIELLQTVDAIRRSGAKVGDLFMPYVPFSRQDRVMNKGESLSLKVFCDLINSCHFSHVHICDPHSDVTPALINNCVVSLQEDIFFTVIRNHFKESFYLVSPDGGSLKKTYKLFDKLRDSNKNALGVIECSKRRDVKDGKIIGCNIHLPGEIIYDGHLIIIDDIADGCASFFHLANELIRAWIDKSGVSPSITLMVTHGFFTKGIEAIPNIDNVWCRNNGWIKRMHKNTF